jgi:hypothetical protein
MSINKDDVSSRLKVLNGEFTTLLLNYWELLGSPPLNEFVSMLPIHDALEHIEMKNMGRIEVISPKKMN